MSRKKDTQIATGETNGTAVVEPVTPVASTLPLSVKQDSPGDKPFLKFGPYPTNEKGATLSAAIWRKEVMVEGGELVTVYSIALTRTYFDKDNLPKSSGSIRAAELPLAILLLEKCENFLKGIKGLNGNGH